MRPRHRRGKYRSTLAFTLWHREQGWSNSWPGHVVYAIQSRPRIVVHAERTEPRVWYQSGEIVSEMERIEDHHC